MTPRGRTGLVLALCMALLGPAAAALGSTVGALKGKSAQRFPVSLSAKKYLRAEHARGRVFRLTARLT
jgi:hypothetical protein